MKRLLLATAAVIALAVAAPMAAAQYTNPPPATAPYTTPLPDDPVTPQDESLSAQSNTATQSQSTLTTPGVTDPMPSTTAQTDTDVNTTTQTYSQTQPYGVQAQTGANTQSYSAQTGTSAQTYGATTTDSYASASGMGENTATLASLEEHARDAGMDGMPMTAQAVCSPREISLTTSGSRLSRDKQHQLVNAADRASVCEFQRVVINSPNGRADEARQLLIDHGVDAGVIEVVDSDTGGLEVQMHFAGIATSSEQYAQLFSTQQYASYQPSTTAPGYTTSTTPYYQAPPLDGPSTMDDPSVADPDADPVDDMDDGMSPTSGQPAVQPGMLDI